MTGNGWQDSIADLRGSMEHGFDPAQANRVLSRISAAAGVRLACVWDYCDAAGPGGNSDLYLLGADGRVREAAGDLRDWLSARPGDLSAPISPGLPDTWAGQPAGFTAADLAYDDGFCNYARRDDGEPAEDCRGNGTEVKIVTLRVTVPSGTADDAVIGLITEGMPRDADPWVLEVR